MKVSVLVITYNHRRFIEQSLDSILRQQTTFDFEVVIGEDGSTDGTRDIVRSYHRRHVDKIRLLLPEKNLGMMANFIQTFQACRGEYIAILEGDDYWTVTGKLQRQVDFLDAHPECSECFHDVEVVGEGAPDDTNPFALANKKPLYSLEDIAAGNFIPTCSMMMRARSFPEFPDWYLAMPMADWPLHVMNAERGPIGYLPEHMAAYRRHEGGVWSSNSRLATLNKSLFAIALIERHLGPRYRHVTRKTTVMWEWEAIRLLLAQRQYRRSLKRAGKAVVRSPQIIGRMLVKTSIDALVSAARSISRLHGPG